MKTDPLNLMHAAKLMLVQNRGQSWPTWNGEFLDRTEYVTASEASRCARDLAFEKMMQRVAAESEETPLTEDDWNAIVNAMTPNEPLGYFERGHNIEAWYVETIRRALDWQDDAPDELFFAGDEQVSFHVAEDRVSGTPDGVHQYAMGQVLFEVKSVGADVYRMTRPKSAHAYQVNVSIGIFNKLLDTYGAAGMVEIMGMEGAGFHPSPITHAEIHYINSNNYMDSRVFTIQHDGGEAYEEAAEKSRMILDPEGRLRDPLTVEAQGVTKGIGCGFCKFKPSCKSALLAEGHTDLANKIDAKPAKVNPKKLPDLFSTTSANELGLARKYVQAKVDEQAAKAKIEALKADVQKLVEGKEGSVLPVTLSSEVDDVYILSVTRSEGATRVNKDLLAEMAAAYGFSVDDVSKKGPRTKSLRMSKRDDG